MIVIENQAGCVYTHAQLLAGQNQSEQKRSHNHVAVLTRFISYLATAKVTQQTLFDSFFTLLFCVFSHKNATFFTDWVCHLFQTGIMNYDYLAKLKLYTTDKSQG